LLVVTLSLVPLVVLFFSAHRSNDYRPLFLGAIAAIGLYICKFRLSLDVGTYITGATLFGSTIWSVKLSRDHLNDTRCSCIVRAPLR
jgi:hypothetical protein